jgi:hypothetical protein
MPPLITPLCFCAVVLTTGYEHANFRENVTATQKVPFSQLAMLRKPLPSGWTKIVSQSVAGEFIFLNSQTGARQAEQPTTPAGWIKVASQSIPGEFVFENAHTGERQAWEPTETAQFRSGKLTTPYWYALNIPKSLAQTKLHRQASGSFVMSKSSRGYFAELTVVAPNGSLYSTDVHNVRQAGNKGIAIDDMQGQPSGNTFTGIDQFVQFYTKVPGDLPCLLLSELPRTPTSNHSHVHPSPTASVLVDSAIPPPRSGGVGDGGSVGTKSPPYWYGLNVDPDVAKQRLQGEPPGTFVLRKTAVGFAELVMVGPNGMNYSRVVDEITDGDNEGIGITDMHGNPSRHVFVGIDHFVEHYSSVEGELPCLLAAEPVVQRTRVGRRGSLVGRPQVEREKKAVPYWYGLKITKQEALSRIEGKPPGTFVLRASTRGYAALTMVQPDLTLFHKVVRESPDGISITTNSGEESDLCFTGIDAFVNHFATNQSDLPCKLIAEVSKQNSRSSASDEYLRRSPPTSLMSTKSEHVSGFAPDTNHPSSSVAGQAASSSGSNNIYDVGAPLSVRPLPSVYENDQQPGAVRNNIYDVGTPLNLRRSWDCMQTAKSVALAKLADMGVGTFVVRSSSRGHGVLSMVPPGNGPIFHKIIIQDERGLTVANSNKFFPNAEALVSFYTLPGHKGPLYGLPCALTRGP